MRTKNEQGTNDIFAQIANQGANFSNRELVLHEPISKEEKFLPLNGEISFIPELTKKIRNSDELQIELERQREYYAPFMQDLAPPFQENRSRTYLTDFYWRMQTEEDTRNFQETLSGAGAWEKIKIPHYWGPIGKATSYYRNSFHLTPVNFEYGSLFLCFKAVDYKAHVFLNHSYIGSHEGFFAPFEFDISKTAREGENSLLIVVENEIICGNDGNKIYAATGLGYDDPELGWHHCPPGMGIYQELYIESRASVHIHDIFVRPNPQSQCAEAWIEVFSCETEKKEMSFELSLYGQNFSHTVFRDMRYNPSTNLQVGLGDSFGEARHRSKGTLGKAIPLLISNGFNYFKIPFEIEHMRWWEPSTPWLYQLQVKIIDCNENVIDTQKSQFGMRSFEMDEDKIPKGALYLNGRQIRLRGANTMGHEQQCVFKKDWNQLRDDILLAKICNMNFWRLTQRPVQPEVYDYCDKLGLMTQTDLPHFGIVRRNQFSEGVRQSGEMERLIRSHPCNILVSFINEPFPNAGNRPHLHFERNELLDYLKACDIAVHMCNPDRVIKPVDGDYDPPAPGIPDNHCYTAWYNGSGVDVGRLNKGYWMPVKPHWYYGCGEFGAEGLDSIETMRKYYPTEWLPQNENAEKDWSPNQIVGAQTGAFHYFFFDTPDRLEDWILKSQKHQAWAVRMMTEAFRRDELMTTFAVHLFIDAFPAGWMKSIMDVDRNPKSAYFEYREALTPLMVNLRCDRYKAFSGDDFIVDAWICNDSHDIPKDAVLYYQVEFNGNVIHSGHTSADIPKCSSKFQGYIKFETPEVDDRSPVTIQLALINSENKILHDTTLEIEVFKRRTALSEVRYAYILGQPNGKAKILADELGLNPSIAPEPGEIILIDDYAKFQSMREKIEEAVEQGSTLVFLCLPPGEYCIFGNMIRIKPCAMLPMHFVSRKTSHSLVEGFKENDFRLWYDPQTDYLTPILETTFTAEGFEEILTSGNTDSTGKWQKALAVAQKKMGKGSINICQLELAGKISTNPIAFRFARRFLHLWG